MILPEIHKPRTADVDIIWRGEELNVIGDYVPERVDGECHVPAKFEVKKIYDTKRRDVTKRYSSQHTLIGFECIIELFLH